MTKIVNDAKVIPLRPYPHPMGLPSLPLQGPTAARMAARRALNVTPIILTREEKDALEKADTDDLVRRYRTKAAEAIKTLHALGHGAEAVRLFQALADELKDVINEGNGHA